MGITGCPICYEPIITVHELQQIPYQDGEKSIHIEADITIWTCTNCQRQWDDREAELTRWEAIDNFLESKQK